MDAFLAIASRREVREYADRPLSENSVRRILEAGRVAGSAQNRQPWRFLVLEDPELVERLAETVFDPGNLRGAALVVAIAVAGKGPISFDAGRSAQNMLLAAWNEGIGSSPNGLRDAERAREMLRLGEEERPVIILSFGYPARPRDPESRSADEWLARANRKPLDEIVERR